MKFKEKATGVRFDSWKKVRKYFCAKFRNTCSLCPLSGCSVVEKDNPWENCGNIINRNDYIRLACDKIGFEIIEEEAEANVADDQKVKADDGKLKLCWVPQKILPAIAYVRMYGYSKYKEQAHHWDDASEERYQNAAYRHWLAYLDDPNGIDAESGLPHLWHLACNVAFLVTKRWHEHFKIARIKK